MKHFPFASQGLYNRSWRALLAFIAVVGLFAIALNVSGTPTRAAGSLPCDIYASGGTPCVAAHSTTRALYSAYNGNLYQVRRSSDNTTLNIGVLSAGGYANAAAQDSFCANTTCVITIIYDQSGRGNHLTQAPPGGFAGPAAGGYDNLADATAAPTVLNGHKAYGVYVAAGTGYRNNNTNGIATGDQPEGMYAIFDGTHYNGGCCFDYGNAETDSRDDGNGTMEAIYFGNIKVWGYGTGNGPWIMADLENGLYSGVNAGYNANDPTINYRYTTAIIKGEANHWSIRGGNAQSGSLSTFYNGARPNVSGYNPMKKQGAIILGIGGDNSHGATGTFYEGVMTSGYPSDATENEVQASIVAAGYGSNVGGTPTPTPTQNPSGYAVNAGGSATGSFGADGYYSGGSTYSTTSSIDTSGVSNPAPQSVYQTERYGDCTYTLTGLTPGASYTVRLHFAEIYWTSSGQRLFNVSINGQQVLNNFDIYATAGAANKAIVEQYTTTANSNGQIAVQLTTVQDNAKISGIEVIGSTSSNLLTNGNAEAGTTGWSVFGSGTLTSNTSVVHGGTRSLLLTGRTASWNGISQDLTSRLVNGKSYTTNVWVRTQSGTPSAKVTLAVTANGSTSYITLTSTTTVNASGWTLLSGTTTVSWSGTLSNATWYVETTSGTDSFSIDDASFQ